MSHVESELAGYQLGALDEEARGRVEAHLVECAECVRAFVEIKRAIETSEAAPAPSDAARARLRRAAKREMGIGERTWWERPVAIALAASVVLVASATMHALTTTDGSPPYALQK
jgi:anti-sigma factor RsiW